MSRLLPITSQRTFLRAAVVALAATATEAEMTGRSSLLEDCLVSLTLEEMCHIVQVQGRVGYRHPATVLEQALDAIERTLYQPDSSQWSQYWQSVRETLKQPASQLELLQARLITPLRQEEMPERQRVEEGVEVPFEIMHLPELGALVAVPLKEPCYLHLERAQAQEHWVVSGDYYPLEIQVDDLTFVVSSAGEVLLQVQNFPKTLVRQVMEMLRVVAQTLYTDGKPHFRARVEEQSEAEGD
ncbi:hypothetical protein H6F86_25945 [Phormidium sp. FACHB-592]|uniref:Uncharacterized protein n=1 Tax=Stenomitos frigidus AS-A4 TaxID=2933935 RepID=A0ABV0KSM6_9CYAN|nr:hypothetical protein [Phormidium sp. FACHB-592]MBD2077258.1 hypothetical protein [Phormidium sp. FACHB-592]